jgi:hypothetical protein
MFSNKSALNNHMKTAKYCLDIQNVKPLENKCKGCGKNFLKKFNYDRHIQSCIKIKFSEEFSEERQELKEEINRLLTINSMHESTIKNLHDQIKELQDKLENVAIKAAERPTIQNNNRISQIINNLQPLKMEDFKHHTQYLTLDHIKDGASGYAKYALEYPLKDKVICVDYARRKVKYKDENGNLVNDPEMTKISQKFFTDIEESNNNLIKEYNKIILEKMISVNEGTEEISEEEAERCLQIGNQLMDEMMRVKNLKHGIDEIKNGKKPDLLHDFVKDVCSKTTC